MDLGRDQEKDVNQIKRTVNTNPCLAHNAKDKENLLTTDASKNGLGITL